MRRRKSLGVKKLDSAQLIKSTIKSPGAKTPSFRGEIIDTKLCIITQSQKLMLVPPSNYGLNSNQLESLRSQLNDECIVCHQTDEKFRLINICLCSDKVYHRRCINVEIRRKLKDLPLSAFEIHCNECQKYLTLDLKFRVGPDRSKKYYLIGYLGLIMVFIISVIYTCMRWEKDSSQLKIITLIILITELLIAVVAYYFFRYFIWAVSWGVNKYISIENEYIQEVEKIKTLKNYIQRDRDTMIEE